MSLWLGMPSPTAQASRTRGRRRASKVPQTPDSALHGICRNICVCVYIYTHIMHMRIYIYMCIYVCVYICIYICICVNTHTCVCVCMYIYIQISRSVRGHVFSKSIFKTVWRGSGHSRIHRAQLFCIRLPPIVNVTVARNPVSPSSLASHPQGSRGLPQTTRL